MKKFTCILLTFAMAAAFFACAKEIEKPAETTAAATAETKTETATLPADVHYPTVYSSEVIAGIDIDPEAEQYLYICSVPTINRNEPTAKPKPNYTVPEGMSEGQQIHWPMIPVIGTEPFQVAACAEMSKNPKFDGAKIIKDQYLQLGEINGEPCVRVHLDTDKGDFVAVMNEACEIIWVWTEGEEKTVQYYFPQEIDINVATNEALMQAYHIYHADEHYKNGIICNAIMAMGDCTDGSTLYKVTFIATTGDFSVWIDEFGRVIERTK